MVVTKKKGIKLRKTRKKLKNMSDVKPEIVTIKGYKILLLPNKNNTINIKAYINNGFITETKETSGINHLLEHVLFSAWKKCNNKPCDQLFWHNGITGNATTSDNILTYYIEGLNDKIDMLLEYIITITTKPYITKDLLEAEKTPVLNEELILKNNRVTNLWDLLAKNLYSKEGLKYMYDSENHIKNLKKLDLKKIREVFNKYYTPNNIIYTVSGDYNKNKLLGIFKKFLPKNKYNKSIINRDCFNKNRKKLLFDKDKTAKTGTILYVFPVELYRGDKNLLKLYVAISSLNHLLHKTLRYKYKVTYSIHININTTACGTLITIKTNSQCKNIKKIYKILDSEIEKYKREGISEKLLFSEKKLYLYNYINNYNNPHTLADFYGYNYIHQINNNIVKLHSIKEAKNIILDTTVDEIKNLFKLVFNKSKAVKAYQCSTRE